MMPGIPLDVAKLKQQAWDLKQASGQKLGHCYHSIAQNHGYRSWAALLADQKAINQKAPS